VIDLGQSIGKLLIERAILFHFKSTVLVVLFITNWQALGAKRIVISETTSVRLYSFL
jgi:hypothetical protein